MSDFELHPDRLATTDEKGRRVFLFPSDVKGFFRRRRTWVQSILILFFLALPWVNINGRQALLLNIADRKFEIFGLSLRAHNAPLLLFIFAAAAFGLFFATAVWGRIWCGWACPQTVFIDGVFRRIERWVEGSALERRKLDRGPWTAQKILKRSIKWLLYTGASLIITHSFLAYFVGTEELASMVTQSPLENWGSFLFMATLTGIILFDFAWFREQFCIIACPYGRFQSVLMDSNSQIVAYDVNRGEPRATPQAKALAKTHGTSLGDCVNCYRCVQVCPTGIDIRRGVQMECIACTACIDACDDVMTKLKKPTGLIRYDTLNGLEKKPQSQPQTSATQTAFVAPQPSAPQAGAAQASTQKSKPRRFAKTKIGPRAWVYLSVVVVSLVALFVNLYSLKPVDAAILRAKYAPYTVQKSAQGEEMILNHFKIELSNQSGSSRDITFEVGERARGQQLELITALRPFPLGDGVVTQADLFIRFPKSLLQNGQRKIDLLVKESDAATGESMTLPKEVTLVGPFN